MAARPRSRMPTSRAPTARSTPTSRETRRACARCSASSRSRAGSAAMSRRRRQGSIHEGGELGYALSHAYGAAFDDPDLVVFCVIGDGEAETGPLATSWHSNKFLDPASDGAVAPDPPPQRLQDRQPDDPRPDPANGARAAPPRLWLRAVLRVGRRPGPDPPADGGGPRRGVTESPRSSARARDDGDDERPRWPMIMLRTPKGWTGPEARRRPAGRGQLPLAPGAVLGRARQPGPSRGCSRTGCAATAPPSCSTSRRAAARTGQRSHRTASDG